MAKQALRVSKIQDKWITKPVIKAIRGQKHIHIYIQQRTEPNGTNNIKPKQNQKQNWNRVFHKKLQQKRKEKKDVWMNNKNTRMIHHAKFSFGYVCTWNREKLCHWKLCEGWNRNNLMFRYRFGPALHTSKNLDFFFPIFNILMLIISIIIILYLYY